MFQGDSGGPLFYKTKNKIAVQIGKHCSYTYKQLAMSMALPVWKIEFLWYDTWLGLLHSLKNRDPNSVILNYEKIIPNTYCICQI